LFFGAGQISWGLIPLKPQNRGCAVNQSTKPTTSVNLAYGAGDLAINLHFNSVLLMLLFFYTDVVGISPAMAGAIFVVARIVDAVTDPLMGWIADRTRTSMGRFRPYILLGAFLTGALLYATFSAPFEEQSAKVLWAFGTYILFGVAYTVMSIPYSALTAAITDDTRARTTLSSYRMVFATIGVLIVYMSMRPIVEAAGGGVEGYQYAALFYAVLGFLVLIVTVRGTRENVALPEHVPSIKDMLAALRGGGLPLAMVIVTFFMGMLVFTIRSAALIFYFKYNIGDESLFEVFLAVSLGGQLIGIIAAPFIAARLGKMRTNLLGFIVVGVAGMGLFYTPYDQIGLIFAIASIGSLFVGLITVIGWSLLPDTVEYAEWRTGIRADGAIYAVASFFHKMSMAVGGFIGAMILTLTDYVPNAAQQSEAALNGIAFAVGAAPAVCLFVAAIAIYFYPLDEKTFQKISAELRERRGGVKK